LLNDGHGNFTDATDAAGLGKKRWRRTYSASLADLDGDGHLDLLVVSDFCRRGCVSETMDADILQMSPREWILSRARSAWRMRWRILTPTDDWTF
jgi:hypothetical protein